jgi:hypothetical protein
MTTDQRKALIEFLAGFYTEAIDYKDLLRAHYEREIVKLSKCTDNKLEELLDNYNGKESECDLSEGAHPS